MKRRWAAHNRRLLDDELVAVRIQKRRNPDRHPRPADEQNPVLRGFGQVTNFLLDLLWWW